MVPEQNCWCFGSACCEDHNADCGECTFWPCFVPKESSLHTWTTQECFQKHGEDNGDTPVNQAETPVRYTYWLLFSRHNSGSKNLIPKTRLSQNYENYHKKKENNDDCSASLLGSEMLVALVCPGFCRGQERRQTGKWKSPQSWVVTKIGRGKREGTR